MRRQVHDRFVAGFEPWPEPLIPWLGIMFASHFNSHRIIVKCGSTYTEIYLEWRDQRWRTIKDQEYIKDICFQWVNHEKHRWLTQQLKTSRIVADIGPAWELMFEASGRGRCHLDRGSLGFKFRWRDESAVRI